MQRLEALAGQDVKSIEPISGSGSNRSYYRIFLADGTTVIGVIGTSKAENQAFIYLSEYFSKRGLRVPRVLAVSSDFMAYTQQDLGDTQLIDCLERTDLIAKTIEMLPDFQLKNAAGLDFSRCYPVEEMDRRSVMWDLNYFKYCFLKPLGVEIDEPALEAEFDRLATIILSARPLGFMVRDFQSRNVMIHNDEPWLIDFQGGRRGPVHYDVASFLWQARAGFSDELRSQMVDCYVKAAGVNEADFKRLLPEFIAFRMIQVLGAYGFRGLYERKQKFLGQIPQALATLTQYLNTAEYPYLSSLASELKSKFTEKADDDGRLTIEVLSFSYKKGLPVDNSGNGGGFVFDCRSLNNPGRYDQYKKLTGRDPEVIKFLEDDGGIIEFLEKCAALVDPAVSRYVERGFTHLQVAFGCTGGRHRSLYSADHMAEHLRRTFPADKVKVVLHHREQPQLQ